jgi:hypothetical protein
MPADNFCFYLQNWLIQINQTGGQWYSYTSPFSIPWFLFQQKSILKSGPYIGKVCRGAVTKKATKGSFV